MDTTLQFIYSDFTPFGGAFSVRPAIYPVVDTSSNAIVVGNLFTSSVSPCSMSLVPNIYKLEADNESTNIWYFEASSSLSVVSGSNLSASCDVYFDFEDLTTASLANCPFTVTPLQPNTYYVPLSSFVLNDTLNYVTDVNGVATIPLIVEPYRVSISQKGIINTTFDILPSGSACSASNVMVTSKNIAENISIRNSGLYGYSAATSDTRYVMIDGANVSASWSTYSTTASYIKEAATSDTASYLPFNGNRAIKRSGYVGIVPGGQDVDTFLDNFFYPFIPATFTVNGGGYYETGSSPNVPLNLAITLNDETLPLGTGSFWQDGIYQYDISTSYINLLTFTLYKSPTSTHTYQYFAQTLDNGSIASNVTNATFVYPYLYGMSATSGLSGSALYNAMTVDVTPQASKAVSMVGSGVYIYFAYPSTYPDLTSILDPNGFQVLPLFYKSTVSVTSVGLNTNWTTNYTVYQTVLLSNPNGNFTFS